jgi:GNAT superfamily N-acetyltransferase
MWVSPEARGTGIARALLDRITDWAKRKHCEALALDVTTINTAAVSLYKSAGFAPSGSLEALRDGSAFKIQPMVRKLRDAA